MSQPSIWEINHDIINKFLVKKEIPKALKVQDHTEIPFGYIYCIENIKTHKKYIGAVYSNWTGIEKPDPLNQLRKRASNYIYEYHSAKENKTNVSMKFTRPIIQALANEGIENFIMYPIAETTKANHSSMEKMLIAALDTINNGYNVIPGGGGVSRLGTPHTAKGKLLRSDGIICININQKQIIFADSMKLFGDFMGSSKDMIKNSNRKGRPYKGWFIFYLNDEKRNYILNTNVLGNGLSGSDKHSESSRKFYADLSMSVSRYINDTKNSDEYFNGFTILPKLEYKD